MKQVEEDKDAQNLDPDAKAKYWDDLLKLRYEEQQQRDAAAELGKGKRARKQVCFRFLIFSYHGLIMHAFLQLHSISHL